MNKNKLISEILREYERDRQAALETHKFRTAEIYKICPEIKEIDESLAECSIKISRAILAGEKGQIEKMAEENQCKQAKREKLLAERGFPSGYLEDIYKCSKCFDTGFGTNGEKCTCFLQRLINRYYRLSNLSRAFDNENFDTFDFKYYSTSKDENSGISPRQRMEITYGTVIELLASFGKEPVNLFFHGKAGLGKTFMCNCIAKEVLNMGHTVLYAPAAKLFKTIEDARFHREEMIAPSEKIDFFYSSALLIIDDLGTEFSTLATKAALFDIVNSRILDGLSTIITSNLTLKELEKDYSDRVGSRFLEHYIFCHFIGDDIRKAKKYAFKGQGGK